MDDYDVMGQGGRKVQVGRRYVDQRSLYMFKVALSWVAYIAVAKVLFISLAMTGLLALAGFWLHKDWLVLIGVGFTVIWVTYEVAKLRVTYLFSDPAGVWVSVGVFPWQRGFYGLPWRQVGGASYQRSFLNWLSGSYRVKVYGRFNQDSSLVLENVRRGDLVASHINQIVAEGD